MSLIPESWFTRVQKKRFLVGQTTTTTTTTSGTNNHYYFTIIYLVEQKKTQGTGFLEYNQLLQVKFKLKLNRDFLTQVDSRFPLSPSPNY